MEVNTREVEGVLIVDLFGQFPRGEDEIRGLADTIRDAIVGQSKSIIFNMPDADRLSQAHVGALARALKQANVPLGSISIVSPTRRIREVFNVLDGIFRVYETEDEALNPRRGRGCFLLVMIPVLSFAVLVVWLLAV